MFKFATIRDLSVMFYIEDSTIEDTNNLKDPVKHDEQLLILDGTTCLDYTTDEPGSNSESWIQSVLDQVKNF